MKFLLPILALLLLSAVTFADSTQQYNKLYLSPFYKDSLTNNVNSSFSVSVSPPDRIAEVSSAIIYFNVHATGQTTNYSIWMNGQQCNTKNFYVSTTYATSGQIQLSFDCTNVLTTSGDYSIILRPSGSNTGAVTGWLEITYMNNPHGQIKYMGATDYFSGEDAIVFVQLQDATGAAVNNASCNFDMYNASNPLLNPIYLKQPMVFRGSDGIYYYKFSTAGLPTGVYPLDAECSYIYDNFFYWQGSFVNTINWTQSSGTYDSGDSLFLNFFDDLSYLAFKYTAGGGTKTLNVTFNWNGIGTNISQLDLYWHGEAAAANTIIFSVQNKTSGNFINLGSVSLPASVSAPTGIETLFTARIPDLANTINSTQGITINLYGTSAGSPVVYMDWLTLKAFKNTTYVSEVKGSSEVHIYPDFPNLTVNVNASQIWNYLNRTLTEYNNSAIYDNILNTNSTLYAEILAINTTLPSAVWSYVPRTLTDYNLTETYNLLTGMSNLTAAQVWSYGNKTLDDYNTTELYNLLIGSSNLTAAQVWSYSTRTLTDYNNSGIATDISLIPAYTWNYTTRTLTDYNLTEIKSLLVDTNNTVYMNKASLATALVLLATINSTVFAIDSNTNNLPAWMSDLIATTHQTNNTANLIWAFLQNASLNITVNATAIVNSTQIAEELAGFDYYEYYVTPQGNIPIATGSLFGGIAYAAPNGYSSICLDQSTLQVTVVKVRCIDNNCKTIETNTTEQCNYGCDSTAYPPACSPSTSTAGMWFFFIIIFIVIVMILLVRWATKRY